MDWIWFGEQERGITITSLLPPATFGATLRPEGTGCIQKNKSPHQHHRHPGPRGLHRFGVQRSLRVLDGSVTILAAKGQCRAAVTGTVWRRADEYKVPRMVYVNKMDTMGADLFPAASKMLHMIVCTNGVAINCHRREDAFRGIVDLVDMN